MLFGCCGPTALGQTVRSTVRLLDSLTQQPITGATLRISPLNKSYITDSSGFARFNHSTGIALIQSSHIGYKSVAQSFTIHSDTTFTIALSRRVRVLDEVMVSATTFRDRVTDTRMSTAEITARQLETIPALLGEKDVVKALLLTPGVKTQTEGSTAIYVRGGGPDQNLFLLNGKPLYFTSHLFGLLTPYNPDVLSRATLSKGGFPAWYGGRLSSVVDVGTRSASFQKTELSASVGLLAARAVVGVPLVKDKLSLLVAGRRSFLDALLVAAPDAPIPGFSFYDADTKLSYRPRPNQSLSLFLHSDQDAIRYRQAGEAGNFRTDFRWQNRLGGLDWLWSINEKTNLQADAGFSAYRMRILSENTSGGHSLKSNFLTSLNDFSFGIRLNRHTPKVAHTWGIQYAKQHFDPGSLTYQIDTLRVRLPNRQSMPAQSLSAYYQSEFSLTSSLRVSVGARLNAYHTPERTYYSPEPRLTLTKQVAPAASLKLAYSRMQQPLHLLSNPGLGFPLDLWFPASENIAPATSQQVALGYFKQFSYAKNDLLLTLETYYKHSRSIVSYRDGYSSNDVVQFSQLENPSFATLVTVGQGRSWGIETLLEKKGKTLSGWLGYTLAWTQQQFPDLNKGAWFYPRYDRRHDISLTLSYLLNSRWRLNVNWVYGTGQAITLPVLGYQVPKQDFINPVLPASSQLLYTQGDRNAYRMRPYHRLDISLQRTYKSRWGESTLEFGLYNTYNRRNPFLYQLATKNGEPRVQSVSLLPVLPAISYKINLR